MSVTKTERDISKLTATAQTALKLLAQECFKAGIKDVFVTETYRSQARQNYLYEQGRIRLYDNNGKRLSKVTWTKSSIHTSGRAWDLAVTPPKDLYDSATLAKVGAIAKKLNIEWGGYWTETPDKPHFQIDANWSIPKNYALEGTITVPTSSSEKIKFTPSQKSEINTQKEVEVENEMKLNETGKDSCKKLIKAGVAEGLFSSKHEKVESYSDGELVSYAFAYIARKMNAK